MKHLPDWFPGAGFKQIGRLWGSTLSELTERPYAFVKHQMAEGFNEASFLSDLLQQPIANEDDLFTVKCSAMSLFTAGADTVSILYCFEKEMKLIKIDRFVYIMFLLGHDSISRCSTESARRN